MKNLDSLALKTKDGEILVLDQTRLPHHETWVQVESEDHLVSLIQALSIRGAPLIGVVAAVYLSREIERGKSFAELVKTREKLYHARPTAVNLMNALERVIPQAWIQNPSLMTDANREKAKQVGVEVFEEDAALCRRMGEYGASLIQSGQGILTHCNSGGLATSGVGTAFGVLRVAHEQGKKIHVFVDETRPLLQGARLTAWELEKLGIPYTLICDNMASFVMKQGKIQNIFVGCDRIARNGDFANKIGTYGVAVAAYHHQVPFYVVGPRTTLDANAQTGQDIPIEQRDPKEVRRDFSPVSSAVYNPSFDVTDAKYVTAWVLDSGIYREPRFY